MAAAHRETEIKLEVPPAAVDRLKRHLRRHAHLKEPARENDLTSIYFDTKRQRLHRKGFSLRVREEDQGRSIDRGGSLLARAGYALEPADTS